MEDGSGWTLKDIGRPKRRWGEALLGGLFYFAHLHLDLLIAALPLCISSYRFELWVPIERHWLGMHIMIWSLNGALPFYNTIIACVLHELSKAQLFMLLTLSVMH